MIVDVTNYDLVNLNDLFRTTETLAAAGTYTILVDFYKGLCYRFNYLQDSWISTVDTSATYTDGTISDDKIYCTGVMKDSTTADVYSLNGSKVMFFGVPLAS